MTLALRILIVGGYGTFGGRLVELLEDDARLTLLIAGRSIARAREFCASRTSAHCALVATEFSRTESGPGQLAALRPDIVVDASGPFQAYAGDRYRLIEQCIAAGVHYLDLADGSDFVAGVAQFDAAARAAGVFMLSGVSSFPVLTAAVVRRLAVGMTRVESIRGGIAPSPFAGVGLNVIRAIASYAGQPVARQRNGVFGVGHPFTESSHFVISVPGRVPLASKRFSLVDVPDLRILAALWPQASSVWMGAAPVPASLHWVLTAFAWAVRLHVLRSLSWLPRAMHWAANRLRWGEHRGGMFVEVCGRGPHDEALVREWHLLAEGDDGPLIPCMGVEAIVRRMLAGGAPSPGARAAVADVNLVDYEALFTRRSIHTGVRERAPLAAAALFQQVLGPAWDDLPRPVQALHALSHESQASTFVGRCSVQRGRNPLARAVAAVVGFPEAGDELPIEVKLCPTAAGEQWQRTIGGKAFRSVLQPGQGRSRDLLRERFGPIAVDMALIVEPGGLRYVPRRWSLFGLYLPMWLGPCATAIESVDQGRFVFSVELSHPLTGLIVRYRGWLSPQRGASAQ